MTNSFFNTSKSSRKHETPRGSSSINYQAQSLGSSGTGSQYSTPGLIAKSTNQQEIAPEKTGTGPSPTKMEVGQHLPARSGRTDCLLDQTPESMVAETLKMKGELEFTRLLRVDGRFEGELVTDNGSLVVGPKGEVVGDLKNMKEVYVEGIVRGNVYASQVKVKNNGMLFGDIQCLQLTLDPTASIKGVADTATLKERAMLEASTATPKAQKSAVKSAAKPSEPSVAAAFTGGRDPMASAARMSSSVANGAASGLAPAS